MALVPFKDSYNLYYNKNYKISSNFFCLSVQTNFFCAIKRYFAISLTIAYDEISSDEFIYFSIASIFYCKILISSFLIVISSISIVDVLLS